MNFLRHRFLFSEGAAGQGGAAAGAGAGAGAGGGSGAAAGSGGGQGDGGQGGGQQQAWHAGLNLDADTAAWVEERKFGDAASALKAGMEGSRLARDRNVMPKPDLKAINEWTGWSELGWSSDFGKYEVAPPKLQDGDVHDQAAFDVFRKVAHDQRLLPGQASAVYAAMHENSQKGIKAIATQGAEAKRQLEQQLRAYWGKDYDANTEIARRAVNTFSKDILNTAEVDALLGSPKAARLFHAMGAAIGEGRLADPLGGSGGIQTPAQARAERQRLEADKDWMDVFKDPRHPRNKDYVATRNRLIELEAGSRA